MSKRAANQPGGADAPEVSFENRIRFLDILDLVFTRASLSPVMQLFGGFFIALGFMALLAALPPDIWFPMLVTGLAIGTGIIYLPFTWSTYLAVPELTEEKVEADRSGMRIHVLNKVVEHPWQVYRTATETERLFILRSRIVPTQIFTKRGIEAADVEAFRAILREVELLTSTAKEQRRKAWIGFIVGAAIAIGLPLLYNVLSILAPA